MSDPNPHEPLATLLRDWAGDDPAVSVGEIARRVHRGATTDAAVSRRRGPRLALAGAAAAAIVLGGGLAVADRLGDHGPSDGQVAAGPGQQVPQPTRWVGTRVLSDGTAETVLVDGGSVTNLATANDLESRGVDGDVAFGVALSADGSTVYYRQKQTTSDGDLEFAVYAIPAGGGAKQRVSSDVWPAFSPDGSRSAHVADDGRLVVTDVSSGAERTLPEAVEPPVVDLNTKPFEVAARGPLTWFSNPQWVDDDTLLVTATTDVPPTVSGGQWGFDVKVREIDVDGPTVDLDTAPVRFETGSQNPSYLTGTDGVLWVLSTDQDLGAVANPTYHLHNTETGSSIAVAGTGMHTMSIDPTGHWIAILDAGTGVVTIHDLTGTAVGTVPGHWTFFDW
jgi:hypothetical protein